MTDRPAPPPLAIANMPCPARRMPVGYDDFRRRLSCNYCGIFWDVSGGTFAVGDELQGQ